MNKSMNKVVSEYCARFFDKKPLTVRSIKRLKEDRWFHRTVWYYIRYNAPNVELYFGETDELLVSVPLAVYDDIVYFEWGRSFLVFYYGGGYLKTYSPICHVRLSEKISEEHIFLVKNGFNVDKMLLGKNGVIYNEKITIEQLPN